MKKVILELNRIVQEVSLIESSADQVRHMVDAISQVTGADVCSLYRCADDGEMVLLASHGLEVVHSVKLPAGKGLVGRVARSRHALNLADASSHPDYFYIKETHEERFSSFCGVPLVRFGEVVGVLVVQRVQAEKLSDEQEAFLATLASQLALIVANISATTLNASLFNQRTAGVSGSPGIGIGYVALCASDDLNDVPDAECEDIAAALQDWRQLLESVQAEIKAEQEALGSALSSSVSSIFEAYQMLLADASLSEKVEEEVLGGQWLPGAIRHSIQYFSDLFRAMDDPYLRARSEDIQHLGNKLYNAWRGAKPAEYAHMQGPVVLVGAQVTVSHIAGLAPGDLAGIVCYEGSRLSHTAVLANAMGIPAVMGVGKLKGVYNGEELVVDGNEGQIVRHCSSMMVDEYRRLVSEEQTFLNSLASLRDQPAITTDGEEITLLTNTGLLADITPGLKNGAEGVGLYRTEIPFIVRDSFPTEDEQVQVYQKVFSAYAGKPVYARTLDIGGDKQLPYYPITAEENPALGWRGIRFTLDNIQLLMTQVRAMIRAAQPTNNLHILLPMLSSSNEIDVFLQLLDDACRQLTEEGLVFSRPRVGAMVEVPAAISQLPFWKKKIDFISIGSNDLSQYLLALDRNNARVANRYDHVHPAVLHEVYRIVTTAKQCQLPVSLCGEMAADPVAVLLLLGMGIRRLSMSSSKLPQIKWLIRSIPLSVAQQFLAVALTLDNVAEIRAEGRKILHEQQLDDLL